MEELLGELYRDLERQLFLLKHSLEKAEKISDLENMEADEFDNFETLAIRYSRTIDFLVRKYWRILDSVEFESQGTLIDVVNRAEKRGLFDDIEEFREMRDLRNEIVHEYISSNLVELFQDIKLFSKKLLEIGKRSLEYGERYL